MGRDSPRGQVEAGSVFTTFTAKSATLRRSHGLSGNYHCVEKALADPTPVFQT